MDPLAFRIERDVEADVLVASWDDPAGGGITTQAKDLTELAEAIKESIRCHFAGRSAPREVTLHFESDPVIAAGVKLPRDLSGQLVVHALRSKSSTNREPPRTMPSDWPIF